MTGWEGRHQIAGKLEAAAVERRELLHNLSLGDTSSLELRDFYNFEASERATVLGPIAQKINSDEAFLLSLSLPVSSE